MSSGAHKRPSLVDHVRHGLLDDLMGGKLEPGAKLPNENELADRYGVSRATVREAVLLLEQAGYLSRRHGSGTYVTQAPRSRHALDTTVSYTAMIRDAGHEPSETVLDKSLRLASDPERHELRLVHGERVVEIERVRLADGRPVIYSIDRIPEALLGELAAEALDSSLYVILASVGHAVVRASAELLPTLADLSLARHLEVKRGSPLLHIDQVDYDGHGRAVMLSQEWHVPDAFEVIVNRRSSPTADHAEHGMPAAVSSA
jgi:GntR family transcriptional regulator